MLVDRASDQLLAGPCFPNDEQIDLGSLEANHLTKQLSDRGRDSDQVSVAIGITGLVGGKRFSIELEFDLDRPETKAAAGLKDHAFETLAEKVKPVLAR